MLHRPALVASPARDGQNRRSFPSRVDLKRDWLRFYSSPALLNSNLDHIGELSLRSCLGKPPLKPAAPPTSSVRYTEETAQSIRARP